MLVFSAAVALTPILLELPVTWDDGFYYLEIARRAVAGEGSTFDGLNSTNGYHPLWLIALVAVFGIASSSEGAHLLAGIVQAMLAVAGVGVLYRLARTRIGLLGSSLATLVWIDLTHRLWLSGLEFSLHALCFFSCLLVLLVRFNVGLPRSCVPWAALGSLTSLTVLARLDSWLWAAVLTAALVVRSLSSPHRPGPRLWSAFALPIALPLLGWAAFSQAQFGSWVPVSAAVKRSWAPLLLAQDPVFVAYGWLAAKLTQLSQPFVRMGSSGEMRPLALGLLAVAAWILAVVLSWRWRAVSRQLAAIRGSGPVVIYAGVQFGAFVFLLHGYSSFEPWHSVALPLLGSLLIGWSGHWLATLRGSRASIVAVRLAGAIVVALLIVVSLHTVRALAVWNRLESGRQSDQRLAAAWINDNLPPETRIGAWNAGVLGWYTRSPVVHLEGLVNSWEYHRQQPRDLCAYWREQGITHIADAYRQERFATVVPTLEQYAHCSQQLVLEWSAAMEEPGYEIVVFRLTDG